MTTPEPLTKSEMEFVQRLAAMEQPGAIAARAVAFMRRYAPDLVHDTDITTTFVMRVVNKGVGILNATTAATLSEANAMVVRNRTVDGKLSPN